MPPNEIGRLVASFLGQKVRAGLAHYDRLLLMRFLLLLIPALLLAALGWCVGPYLCLWLYDGVDALWPHQHSSGTHRYLWGGVGGAMLGRELEQVGSSAGALGFGFLALGALLPRYRVLLFLIPGALGLLGNLVVVILWWNTSIRHGLLLVHGVPLIFSGILLFAGLVALRNRHHQIGDE